MSITTYDPMIHLCHKCNQYSHSLIYCTLPVSTEPFPEPIFTYYQSAPMWSISVKFDTKLVYFLQRNELGILVCHWLPYLLQGQPVQQWLQESFCVCTSQWETALHCNAISHWLDAYTKWSLCWHDNQLKIQSSNEHMTVWIYGVRAQCLPQAVGGA